MKRVSDLREGDLVDLEGDPYADPKGDQNAFIFLYLEVVGVERETDDCVRVDFEGYSCGFPPDHELPVSN